MLLKKISQQNLKKICMSPEHNPPSNYYYEPGAIYEYTCPDCGEKTIVNGPPIVTC